MMDGGRGADGERTEDGGRRTEDESPALAVRPRRLRRTAALRGMVRETRLSVSSLVYPMFVGETGDSCEIASLPGQWRWRLDDLERGAARAVEMGVPAVLLFGIPSERDAVGSSAYARNGIVPRAIRALRRSYPDLIIMADVCLCEYTSHGHCGLLTDRQEVDNDPTLPLLARASVAYADAGADVVAPSDMMDGRVRAIRSGLDAEGFHEIPILSYAAKYSSAFYGPFREAAQSAPQFGDRRGYQMDPANRREALREVRLDLLEGADMVMVKPALAYLDIIREVRDLVDVPVAAYNVSGEYAMVKAAAMQGWLDERATVMEILTAIVRAGADIILSYHAPEAAAWIRDGA
ncbi:MAG TPA: porphobilinogen synthase [Armatimonadota bacterium]|nr:porphobilinogen synthase [Armatimonadota bacterium]